MNQQQHPHQHTQAKLRRQVIRRPHIRITMPHPQILAPVVLNGKLVIDV